MKKEVLREKEEKKQPATTIVLRLFITGATPNSTRAISNIKNICEIHLKGRYTLEIIDVYQQRKLAETEQLIALPMLVRKKPLPERKFVGDLSDTQKVLKGLGVGSDEE